MSGLIVVGRRDLHEEYLAEKMHTNKQLTGPGLDPIVRIVCILRFPEQHSVYFPEIPTHIPPVPGGTICRIQFIRDASDEDIRRFQPYESSLTSTRQAYIDSCTNAVMRDLASSSAIRIRKSLVIFNERDL